MPTAGDRPSRGAAEPALLPSVYPRLVVDAFAPGDPAGRHRLLEGTGLADPQVGPWPAAVKQAVLARLFANAGRGRSPGWHLALLPRLDAAVHGALGFAALSAPTLAAAVEVLLTYGGSRLPFLTFGLRPTGSRLRLTCASAHPATFPDAAPVELAVLALADFVGHFVARDPREITVLVPGAPPAHAKSLAAATPATVEFGHSGFAVEWPRAWQALASPLSDEGLHRLSLERCREQLARACGRTPLEEALRQALLAAGGRPPGLAALAAARHVSPRTLMRQLREAGTSYQSLVDEVRAELALEYLRDTRLPLAIIAERLGFSDTSNFSRAFRSWFGRSPGSCRSPPP